MRSVVREHNDVVIQRLHGTYAFEPIDHRYRTSESLATTEADFDPRILTEAGYQLRASTFDDDFACVDNADTRTQAFGLLHIVGGV